MKIITLLLLVIIISGCDKKPKPPPEDQSKLSAQFEKSDAVIDAFFDKLDSPTTPFTEKKQITCIDFPTEYKNNYVPAMLQSKANTYSEKKLLADMDMALNYYKKKDNLVC